ncbi:glycosyltransferase [Micromonospora sp. M12]
MSQTEGGRFLGLGVGLAHATGLSLVLPNLRIVAPPEKADWLTGPFVAMRRSTFDAIGGVDETSFFYSEDMRLCWAVRQQGLRLAYVPEAVIMHEDDATAKRRWSEEEISERRTREFIRASRTMGADAGASPRRRTWAGAAARCGGRESGSPRHRSRCRRRAACLMRVLFVCTTGGSGRRQLGGAERILTELIPAHARTGIDVIAATSDDEVGYALREAGVPWIGLSATSRVDLAYARGSAASSTSCNRTWSAPTCCPRRCIAGRR